MKSPSLPSPLLPLPIPPPPIHLPSLASPSPSMSHPSPPPPSISHPSPIPLPPIHAPSLSISHPSSVSHIPPSLPPSKFWLAILTIPTVSDIDNTSTLGPSPCICQGEPNKDHPQQECQWHCDICQNEGRSCQFWGAGVLSSILLLNAL